MRNYRVVNLGQAQAACPEMTQDAYNAAAAAANESWAASGKSTLVGLCAMVSGRIKQECHFPNGYAAAQDVDASGPIPPSCDAQWAQQQAQPPLAGPRRFQVGQATAAKEIGDAAFGEVLAAPKAVAMFYSPNCPYSRKFLPIYQGLASQYPDVGFYLVNVDRDVQNAGKYGVRMLPTVVFFTGGKDVNRIDGVQEQSDFTSEMTKAWSGQAPAAAPASAPPRGGTLVESTSVAPGLNGVPSTASMILGGAVALGLLGGIGYLIFGK